MSKPKVAFYWCSSCGGCEEAVVDLAEGILDVVAAVDIAFWPVALDFKRSDVEALPDGALAVSFINGAIRSSEQVEMVELLRRKSRLVVAFGSCAHLGGIPALANFFERDAILDKVYRESPGVDNPKAVFPQQHTSASVKTLEQPGPAGAPNGHTLELPTFDEEVRTLDQTIDVDYYLPGCPPPGKLVQQALQAILEGTLPAKGTVLAPDVALCQDCPRKDTKPEKLLVKEFKRPHLVETDPKTCLLAQGLLCLGPATRSGCDAPCVAGNMPCTGCLGPTSRVRDHGAKALSAVASILDSGDEDEIAVLLDGIPDAAGTFYRYSLAGSLLGGRRRSKGVHA